MSNEWKVVTSKKPRREGEAFLMRGDVFIAKFYADGPINPKELAEYVANQFNRIERDRGTLVDPNQGSLLA